MFLIVYILDPGKLYQGKGWVVQSRPKAHRFPSHEAAAEWLHTAGAEVLTPRLLAAAVIEPEGRAGQ